jgi:transposase
MEKLEFLFKNIRVPPSRGMLKKEVPMKGINILMGLDQRFKLIEVREEGVKVIRVKWRKIEGRYPKCGKKATKVHQVYEKPRRVLHEVMGFRERVYVEYERI